MKIEKGLEVNPKKKGGETMKKLLLLTAVAVLFAAPAMARIGGSMHDFSDGLTSGGTTGTNTQICVYCHTPHNANLDGDKPLWNRAVTAITAVYTNTVTTAGGNTTVVKIAPLCLSCHNGQDIASVNNYGTNLTTGNAPNVATSFNTDSLKGTHPIGFDYAAAQATGRASLKAVGAGGPAQTWFKNVDATNQNIMDCTSCHEVHGAGVNRDGSGTGLFRAATASSALCLTCHDK